MAKINYQERKNYLPEEIAGILPFHAKVIAELSGLSVGQVYYRLRQHGASLRDIRNGLAGIGLRVKREYIVKNAEIEAKPKGGKKRRCG